MSIHLVQLFVGQWIGRCFLFRLLVAQEFFNRRVFLRRNNANVIQKSLKRKSPRVLQKNNKIRDRKNWQNCTQFLPSSTSKFIIKDNHSMFCTISFNSLIKCAFSTSKFNCRKKNIKKKILNQNYLFFHLFQLFHNISAHQRLIFVVFIQHSQLKNRPSKSPTGTKSNKIFTLKNSFFLTKITKQSFNYL